MVGIVVITHGTSARSLVRAARVIVGRQPAVAVLGVDMDEAFEGLVARIAKACDSVDDGSGVLMLLDLHGSTPFNAAMAMLDGTRPAEVVCGVNLPMLIKLATADRHGQAPAALADELKDAGRRSIRIGSELTGKVVLAGTR